eukprot:XP_011678174.1 PREDICTED: uncharacterized protein LOC105444952 [Strongylocentrotus purpuratus]
MRDAEVMRVDVLKQRENELDKYRREQITGGPAKSRVTSLTVSKTPAGFKPSPNNSRTAVASKVSIHSSSSPSLSPLSPLSPPARLKWTSSVPPRMRNPGQTSPRRKKQPPTLPPLRGTLQTNYINIANEYASADRQTPDTTTVGYRLPRKEWSPADSTPKNLEGNPSRMCEISKIWEHGMCIYCELERIEQSIPRPPRSFKWRSRERNDGISAGGGVSGDAGACVAGGDGVLDDGLGGVGDGLGGVGDGDGGDTSDRFDCYRERSDEQGENEQADGNDGIGEITSASAQCVITNDRPRLEYEPDVDTLSSSDESSIGEHFDETDEGTVECVPVPIDDWRNNDDDDMEVDYDALEQIAKWYGRYPSTPVSFWKQQRVQRTFPSFF